MKFRAESPVPLAGKAQWQFEGVRCGIVRRQNPRSVKEFQIPIETEQECIPLCIVSPAYVGVQSELRVYIHANTGLKVLWIDQIHTYVARLSWRTRWQTENR